MSTFFATLHQFKAPVATNAADYAAIASPSSDEGNAASLAAGFKCHQYMATSKTGAFHCVFEGKFGLTAGDLQTYLDTTFKGVNTTIQAVDTKIGGVPFERHFTCAAADVKIVDLVNAKYAAKEKYVAFEYYPPRTAAGVANLTKRFGEMAKQEPLYADMTWGAGGSTSDLTLDLCKKIQHEFGMPANMHLTCTNMDESKITEALEGAKEFGIRNIVALRGDPPEGEEKWEATEGGFACALDLVVHMRKHYGDYFCISVAGYPEGHPNAITKVEDESKLTESEMGRVVRNDDGVFVCTDADYTKELDYLKQKCDAGADLIITQMFFSVAVFLKFVADCRAHGIEAPIIPGIMLLQKYGGFKRMTGLCKSHVPANVVADAEKVKDDADAFKQYGIDFGAEVCQGLLDAGHYGLHLYTLNVTGVSYAVMDKVGLKKSVE